MGFSNTQINQEPYQKRTRYEAPEVIYETVITTRAGSPSPFRIEDPSGVDPLDLFGND